MTYKRHVFMNIGVLFKYSQGRTRHARQHLRTRLLKSLRFLHKCLDCQKTINIYVAQEL